MKSLVRSVVRSSALYALGLLRRAPKVPFLRLLYAHSVPSSEAGQFEQIISRLQELGTFVDTDRCVDMVTGRSPIDSEYFHLSFDDGYLNVYETAAPILARLQVPAIAFVTTRLVRKDEDVVEPVAVGEKLELPFMSWGELGELKQMGVGVGSHGRTHVKLAGVDRRFLEDEVTGSKADLEARLGEECKYIAWPFGRKTDIDSRYPDVVATAGYRASFGAFRGSVYPGRPVDRFMIPRHRFESSWSWNEVRVFARGIWSR